MNLLVEMISHQWLAAGWSLSFLILIFLRKKNKLVPNGNTPLLRMWVPGDIANQRTGWNVKLGSSRLNVLQVGSYSIVA